MSCLNRGMSKNTSVINPVILSIDQGTTSTRVIAFDQNGHIITSAQEEFPQIYPDDGWVEHDPNDIWSTALSTLRIAYTAAKNKGFTPIAIGITNQRETTFVWDRETGDCIYNAIVWQDRRTADICRNLSEQLDVKALNAKTGLLHDPYFSGSKIAWILDNVEGARQRGEAGNLAFGTSDCFLIYKLTGGKSHATDATNASRTNLFNIHTQDWDDDLLSLFNVPASVLPQVLDSSDDFGVLDQGILGEALPIYGVAGDQQAAAIGQACFKPGDIKSTYGTGCFVILNTGDTVIPSNNNLLSTVAYRLGGKTTYAQEGSIFIAGAAVQWLRDAVGLIDDASETETLAKESADRDGLYLVPAFTGLGAPYWDPDARGALLGITRDTSRADIVRATLDSICFQTHDLFAAFAEDGVTPSALRVDGGMVKNDWVVQRLADVLDLVVDRPVVMETTALGAAYLAGLKAGLFKDLDDIANKWKSERQFTPQRSQGWREIRIKGWKTAIGRVLTG